MPRSLQEIDADIAQVKAEIALRDKYIQGFNQPQTKVGWGSYIVNNDRGLLDQYQNRENQWKNAIEQQLFQAEQNRLSRESAEKIAKMNKEDSYNDKAKAQVREREKEMLAAELAQAEYDDAITKVDLDKPETVLAARKAAIKLNYANRNLPYYADDPQSFTVATDFTEDAEPVKINKKVNTAIQTLDPIVASPHDLWDEEQQAAYDEAFEVIKKHRPDLIPKYKIEADKKGATKEERNTAIKAAIANAIRSKNKDLLPKGYTKKSFDGIPYVATKNSEGKWIKVQEWK